MLRILRSRCLTPMERQLERRLALIKLMERKPEQTPPVPLQYPDSAKAWAFVRRCQQVFLAARSRSAKT